MTEIKLIYYSDASHGWLRVPKSLIKTLNMQRDISHFSYESKTGLTVYLEEDSDATNLINKLRDLGIKVSYREIDHGDRSFIRSLPTYRGY